MNGISIENPFALLTNLGMNTGAVPGFPATDLNLMPGVDLLGFVDALEVSQGPKTVSGDDLSALVAELKPDALDSLKDQELGEASSDELLQNLDVQNLDVKVPMVMARIESNTNDTLNVGLKDKAPVAAMSAETLLLGEMDTSLRIAKINPQPRPVKVEDVAAWSQAFAQNDIESMELLSEASPTQGQGLKAKPEFTFEQDFASGQDQSKSHQLKIAKPETSDLKSTVTFESFAPSQKKEAVEGADLLLGREILMSASKDSAQSTATLSSASTLGQPEDTRLSDDSVKMLADKIETLKASGSSTLRVVLKNDEVSKIEIRVQKIGDEILVRLHSDSKDVARVLEDSRQDLVARLSDKVRLGPIEVKTDLSATTLDSVRYSAMKQAGWTSGEMLKVAQASESRMNSGTGDFGSNFSQGHQSQEFLDQRSQNQSRDRGMRQWQGQFEERASA